MKRMRSVVLGVLAVGVVGWVWLDQRDIKREGDCAGGREVHGWNLVGDTHHPGVYKISVAQGGFVPRIPRLTSQYLSRYLDIFARIQFWDDGQLTSEPVEALRPGDWKSLEDRGPFVDIDLFARVGHFQGGINRTEPSKPTRAHDEVCFEFGEKTVAGVGNVYIRPSKEG